MNDPNGYRTSIALSSKGPSVDEKHFNKGKTLECFSCAYEHTFFMKFILGKKVNMSQMYADNGSAIPVTIVSCGPCVVTRTKSKESDGYESVQLGYGEIKKKRVPKPVLGQLKNLGPFRFLREFRMAAGERTVGETITVAGFAKGDLVDVTSTSKGKGFQGVVKRHGFHGHPKSHGHKDQMRMPGAIGAGGVQRVFKGKRMGGHMGDERVTVKNLEVVAIDEQAGTLALKGAVPGARGGLITIRTRV